MVDFSRSSLSARRRRWIETADNHIMSDAQYTPTLGQRKSTRISHRGFFKLVEINHPLVLSLSKDGCRWFDKLTMSGGRRTLERPWTSHVYPLCQTTLAYCHCEARSLPPVIATPYWMRGLAISSPQQWWFADVCSTSTRLPRPSTSLGCAEDPRNDRLKHVRVRLGSPMCPRHKNAGAGTRSRSGVNPWISSG